MKNKQIVTSIREKIINKLVENPDKVFIKKRLFYSLELTSDDWEEFESDLKFLRHHKIILTSKKRKIQLNKQLEPIIGRIYFSPNGFGFLNPVGQSGSNYYVSRENVLNSLHEDLVLGIKVSSSNREDRHRPEAKVICVLKRTISVVVGTYMSSGDFGFVIADDGKYNSDIYISKGNEMKAKSYDKVVVSIEKYPKSKEKSPEGIVTEVIGLNEDSESIEALSIIKAKNIKDKFDASTIREASTIKTHLIEEDYKGRKDYRDKLIYTMDGIDAMDLDDAISVKMLNKNIYELGVHIADVSHYVKEHSAIDKEALVRGTSIYLINNVIPMLPKVLSNSVCSLKEGEDKLALSLIMRIDKNGTVISSEIHESVITSKARLNYDEVTDYLVHGNEEFERRNSEIAESLKIAEKLCNILSNKRIKRGSVDFGFAETEIKLDENGKTTDVRPYDRGISNEIIEEFMLISNETIAEMFSEVGIPFLYRVHPYPRSEKLRRFTEIIESYGYNFDFENIERVEPKELQSCIKSLESSLEEDAFKMLLLQAMQQAKYSDERDIHYGLATDFYCHFTSPIRRYPDLQIHRLIKRYLSGNLKDVVMLEKYAKEMVSVSSLCSKNERIAERAEQELDRIKIVEYMIDNKGKEFEGFIKNFNQAGIFVTLKNSAEGFIKIPNFGFDIETYTATYMDRILKLGQKVVVKPLILNINTKELVFELVSVN